MSKTIEDC